MEEITTSVINSGDSLLIDVIIGFHTDICFKVTNIISSLKEANVLTYFLAEKFPNKIPFYLKLKSDTNKEQWTRILSKAFDDKENKIYYPWTVIVAKAVAEIDRAIKEKKQDFVATEIEGKEPTWLLEPFIQENQINTMFGMGSSGKTLLAMYFAKLVAQEKGINVLFIDYEDCQEGWKSKLAKITGLSEMEGVLDKFIYFDSEQIPLAEQVEKIQQVIKTRKIGLVVVDSASMATGESTSDEKAAVRMVSALKLLRTTCLLIAHQRKNDGDKTPIGSIQYENQSRNVWNVKSNQDDTNNSMIHIAMSHTKANNTWLRKEPFGYCVEYTESNIRVTRESAQNYFEDKYTVIQRIQKLLGNEGGMDYKAIAEALAISPAMANKNLTQGKNKGLFENRDGIWNLNIILPLNKP